jgi:hypothetical protein
VKCINCDASNTLKDRTANMGRCKSCDRPFAFEPTAMPDSIRLTDPFFAKSIDDISAKSTLFFTPTQLYYLLNNKLGSRSGNLFTPINLIGGGLLFCLFSSILCKGVLKIPFDEGISISTSIYLSLAIWWIAADSISDKFSRRIRNDRLVTLKTIAIALIIIGLPLSIADKIVAGTIGSIGLGIAATWLYLNRQRQQSKIFDKLLIDRSQFDDWLEKWTSINNQPPKILPPPQTSILSAVANPEVTAYSFDRVVVCDTPEIAQLLISNNFHFENNCAILTIDGYPQNIFDTTMEMLLRNPDLKVYAFHNCSPNGIELAHRLRAEEKWFPNLAIPIINIGILPRQIMDNFNFTILQSSESAEISQRLDLNIRASLNPAEIAWLDAGCYLELESLSPRKIIHILQRAINESRELTSIEYGSMITSDNSGFYTAESFG